LIYDSFGRYIKTLKSSFHTAGAHSTIWDGRNMANHPVSSGVYVIVFKTADHIEKIKVSLIR